MSASPIIAWLSSWPLDFLLEINEIRASIDWDSYAHTAAIPSASSLVLALVLCKRIIDYNVALSKHSRNLLFSSDRYPYDMIKASLPNNTTPTILTHRHASTAIWALKSFRTLLLALSVAHTYHLFSSVRQYTLMHRTTPPRTPSAVRSSVSRLHWFLFPWFTSLLLAQDDSSTPDPWVLLVWHPTPFPLYFWSVFNPINLLVVNSSLSTLSTVFMVLLILIALYSLSRFFLILIQDKQILYQETFSEYNAKFVHPKTNILKKDVLVDATSGPSSSTILTDTKPFMFQRSKVFVTHDEGGKPIVEYGSALDHPVSHARLLLSSVVSSVDWQNTRQMNEQLRMQNQRLERRLHSMSRLYHTSNQNRYVEEGEHDLDLDRTWFTSATPFIPSRQADNLPTTSTPHVARGSSHSQSTSPFKTARYEYNNINSGYRSPSPVKSFGGHAPDRRVHAAYRSPSPLKCSPNHYLQPPHLDMPHEHSELYAPETTHISGLHDSLPPLPNRSRSISPFKSPGRGAW